MLLRRANHEHKETCASDRLKPLISILTTQIHVGFCYVLHSRFGFVLQEAYLQFKRR